MSFLPSAAVCLADPGMGAAMHRRHIVGKGREFCSDSLHSMV
jgi:hypothetical protein